MSPDARIAPHGRGRDCPLMILTALVVVAWAGTARAQMGMFGQAVGGISVDTHGIIRNLDARASEELAATRKQLLSGAPLAAGQTAGLRKVSLAGVVKAAETLAGSGQALPPEVLFLGGLERITHVFVDPERHDIILAGPADKAVVDPAGNVVAAASGRPLLQLEDLVVALRAIDGARQGGMTCSIDPSAEGVEKLRQYLRGLKSMGDNPEATLRTMESVLGPQRVTVGGVPPQSRFARVLVAADYRLKRIGMGIEPSGIPQLPSYLAMLPPGAVSGPTLPRFWLEADYEPIVRDADELAWRIGDRRMRCVTETDLVTKQGIERGGAATDKHAEKWCGLMTAHYDALSRKQTVFADLVNCVDLAVVAALIRGRQLDGRAGLDLGVLLDESRLAVPAYDAPATVATVATGLKRSNRWVVSASGGITFQPWGFAGNTNESAVAAADRTAALSGRPADGWWWD